MNSPLLPVYSRTNLTMIRGEGAYLFDDAGRRYLDFAAGIAVNSLGHCHPHAVKALKEQADALWHCSNLYHSPPLDRFAARLIDATFADKVFFTNSGVEAIECGVKMIRKFHFERGDTNRYRIITMEGGFHGRSLTAISASQNSLVMRGFEPAIDGFDQVPLNDLEAVFKAITPQTAGIMLEPIQGEGGIRSARFEFLQGLRKLCDSYGLLLFIDEVQCGMGRTGELFAHQMAGITPDICAIAKGIGTGFPLGACLATNHAASGMTLRSHGGTYGGNPLAMAVGNAVLDVILTSEFFTNVIKTGEYLKGGLVKLVLAFPQLFEEVRGRGLMLGLKTRIKHTDFVDALRTAGLLTVSAWDSTIRILPPLIINPSHCDEALHIIQKTSENWK